MASKKRLSQEDIYQPLFKQQYSAIISILHDHKETLKDDESIHHAINTFLREFFGSIEKQVRSEDLFYHLQLLFIIHSKGFYSLPDEYTIKLIGILYKGHDIAMWYEVAKHFGHDPICARIISEHNEEQIRKNSYFQMRTDPDLAKYVAGSTNNFHSEVVTNGPGAPYMKVYVRGLENLRPLQGLLNQLPTVRKANFTEKAHGKDNLTLYLQPPYNLDEMTSQVDATLEAYFNQMPNDPIFKSEVISSISDTAYFQVLDYMIALGESLEKAKRSVATWDENMFRDYFLRYLDTISQKHTATGESFNFEGKTDILFRDAEKKNLLIAECKMWKGAAYLHEAIDQLLGLYITWRYEKAVIMVFNNSVQGFTAVIEKAVVVFKAHPFFHLLISKRKEASYSFIFRNTMDSSRTIMIELVLFNFA